MKDEKFEFLLNELKGILFEHVRQIRNELISRIEKDSERLDRVDHKFTSAGNELYKRVGKLEYQKFHMEHHKKSGISFMEAMQANSEGKAVRLDRKTRNEKSFIELGGLWWNSGSLQGLCKDDFLSNEWKILG